MRLENELPRHASGPVGWWLRFRLELLRRELSFHKAFQRKVAAIDSRLYELKGEEDSESQRVKSDLNDRRENINRRSILHGLLSRIPLLRRYRRPLLKTVREKVIELLTELGVPNPTNVVDRYPHELSGGMQQRIVIAIALACHPKLLIADEPTSNLDVTIQAQILDLIKRSKQTSISSVLFITHDLGVVADICDRVTVMYAGDTCETADVDELFGNPLHPYTEGLLKSVPKLEQT